MNRRLKNETNILHLSVEKDFLYTIRVGRKRKGDKLAEGGKESVSLAGFLNGPAL